MLPLELPQAPQVLCWATSAQEQGRATAVITASPEEDSRLHSYSTGPEKGEMLVRTWKNQLEKAALWWKTQE